MKMRLLTLTICLACVTLLFTACSSREPATPEAFTTLLEDNGFLVAPDGDESAEVSLVASRGDCDFGFMVCFSTQDAEFIFDAFQASIESSKGNSSTQTSVNMGNYNAFKVTSGDVYYHLCRIDNTILLAISPKDDKDEVQDLVKALGY